MNVSDISWVLRNELAYMRLNPQVPASVKRIVFVHNNGDFGNTASSWACELTHARTQPVVALWHVVNKYVHAFDPCGTVPAAHFAAGESLLKAAGATRVLHVQQDPRWGVGYYKDGIHPTAAGFGMLAGVIGDDLAQLDRVGGL